MELQSTVEFMGTYFWIFLSIVLIGAVILILYIIINYNSSYSYCNISSQVQCLNDSITTNSSYTTILLSNKNNLGTTIYFKNNSIKVILNYGNFTYPGVCYPEKVPSGSTFNCKVLVKGSIPTEGSQFTSKFNIFYTLCSKCSNNSETYPITGSIVSTIKYQ